MSEHGGNTYYIQNVESGKVLDVAGGLNQPNVPIQTYKWNGSPAQQWYLTDAPNSSAFEGRYYFRPLCTADLRMQLTADGLLKTADNAANADQVGIVTGDSGTVRLAVEMGKGAVTGMGPNDATRCAAIPEQGTRSQHWLLLLTSDPRYAYSAGAKLPAPPAINCVTTDREAWFTVPTDRNRMAGEKFRMGDLLDDVRLGFENAPPAGSGGPTDDQKASIRSSLAFWFEVYVCEVLEDRTNPALKYGWDVLRGDIERAHQRITAGGTNWADVKSDLDNTNLQPSTK